MSQKVDKLILPKFKIEDFDIKSTLGTGKYIVIRQIFQSKTGERLENRLVFCNENLSKITYFRGKFIVINIQRGQGAINNKS